MQEDLPTTSNDHGLMGGEANISLPSLTVSEITSPPPPLPTCSPPLPPPMEGCIEDSFVVGSNRCHWTMNNSNVSSESHHSMTSNLLMTPQQMQEAFKSMTPQQMQEMMIMQQQIMMKLMQQNQN